MPIADLWCQLCLWDLCLCNLCCHKALLRAGLWLQARGPVLGVPGQPKGQCCCHPAQAGRLRLPCRDYAITKRAHTPVFVSERHAAAAKVMMLRPRDAVHETGRDASNVSRRILQTPSVCQRVSQTVCRSSTRTLTAPCFAAPKTKTSLLNAFKSGWKGGDVI